MSKPPETIASREELHAMAEELALEITRRKTLWPTHVLAGTISENDANRKIRLLADARNQILLLTKFTYFELSD